MDERLINIKIKVEKIFIVLNLFVFIIVSLYFIINNNIRKYDSSNSYIVVVFLIISIFYNILKWWLLNKYRKDLFQEWYNFLKISEAILFTFYFSYLNLYDKMYIFAVIFLLFYSISEKKYSILSLIIFIISFVLHIIIALVYKPIYYLEETFVTILYIITLIILNYILITHEQIPMNLFKSIINENEDYKKSTQKLSEEINTFNKKIIELENELNFLRENNKKLNVSLGEFYNLQEISKIITQILDTKELLRFVNDVLIGVTGVDKSTIFLLNKEKTELYVAYTNINDVEKEESFTQDKVKWLLEKATNSENGFINKANTKEYKFLNNRSTKSFMYASISTKTDKYGIILLEQIFEDIFSDDNLRFLTAIAAQISVALENSSLYQQMRSMAMVDGLTGAYNRIFLFETLEKEMELSDGNFPISIAMFDVDNFKKLNDTYGHLFGDKVLQTIVRIIKDRLRKDDIVARYGGEEFIIVFNHLDTQNTYKVVERIRTAIENEIIEDNLIQTKVTVSFGIATYPNNANTIRDLIKCADIALYSAKRSGKNCTKIFESEVGIKL
ncbi:diguanylate cyclase [Caldicellulosiruptoraceae bacterium PP1]